jgi:hypothetical protein
MARYPFDCNVLRPYQPARSKGSSSLLVIWLLHSKYDLTSVDCMPEPACPTSQRWKRSRSPPKWPDGASANGSCLEAFGENVRVPDVATVRKPIQGTFGCDLPNYRSKGSGAGAGAGAGQNGGGQSPAWRDHNTAAQSLGCQLPLGRFLMVEITHWGSDRRVVERRKPGPSLN